MALRQTNAHDSIPPGALPSIPPGTLPGGSEHDPWFYERRAFDLGYRGIAGVDEAGRGPLAGPVVAAAVILPPDFNTDGIRDSKQLRPLQREDAYERITREALAFGVGICGPDEIDAINILQATYKAMRAALACLNEQLQRRASETPSPCGGGLGRGYPVTTNHQPPTTNIPCVDFALVDGRPVFSLGTPHEAIPHGDALSVSIGAASIVAKVTRDRLMQEMDALYPVYGFAKHKGYLTAEHLEAITKHGACEIHRKSFAPIRQPSLFTDAAMSPGAAAETPSPFGGGLGRGQPAAIGVSGLERSGNPETNATQEANQPPPDPSAAERSDAAEGGETNATDLEAASCPQPGLF